jgi:putative hemolysin
MQTEQASREKTGEKLPLLPLRLKDHIRNPLLRGLYSIVEKPAEAFLGFPAFNDVYAETLARPEGKNFFEGALLALNCRYQIVQGEIDSIPNRGPVVVVANHPYGGVDGVVLGALLTRARPDTRLLVNYLLGHLDGFSDWIFKVDPFGGEGSTKANFQAMRDTLRWLQQGGCLGTFPAGEVSHWDFKQRRVADPLWHDNTARIIRKSKATVVPIYFRGKNSFLFQVAGILHPRLRTALLPREMVKRDEWTIEVAIGEPLPWRKMDHFTDNVELMKFLRMKTELLGERKPVRPWPRLRRALPRFKKQDIEELAKPIDPALLAADVERLPPSALILEQARFKVFLAEADQIKNVLPEIGRLRELTFRMVNEGTGRALDLDRYDCYYLHLFLWDSESQQIAGAYRMGLTDQILERFGRNGFYTSTLFRFKKGFFEQLNPAIELGRSFISPAYQKKHAALGLLWRGICLYALTHPRYHIFFGPVSIDRGYNALSKDLMIQYLRKKRRHPKLSTKVKPRNPPQRMSRLKALEKQVLGSTVLDIDDVSALVMEIERGQKGVPVLLRHYLRMNARLLAFNVDPDFSNALDGLMLVDLLEADPHILKNYMGEEGIETFRQFHGMDTPGKP